MNPGQSRNLTDIERGAIQILLDRALQAEVRHINDMTPKFKGVASELHKLAQGLDDRSAKLIERVRDADTKADSVFKATDDRLDGVESGLKDIEEFVASLDATNGPPT